MAVVAISLGTSACAGVLGLDLDGRARTEAAPSTPGPEEDGGEVTGPVSAFDPTAVTRDDGGVVTVSVTSDEAGAPPPSTCPFESLGEGSVTATVGGGELVLTYTTENAYALLWVDAPGDATASVTLARMTSAGPIETTGALFVECRASPQIRAFAIALHKGVDRIAGTNVPPATAVTGASYDPAQPLSFEAKREAGAVTVTTLQGGAPIATRTIPGCGAGAVAFGLYGRGGVGAQTVFRDFRVEGVCRSNFPATQKL